MNKKIQAIKELSKNRPELTKLELAWLKKNDYEPNMPGVIIHNASEPDLLMAEAISKKISFKLINLVKG